MPMTISIAKADGTFAQREMSFEARYDAPPKQETETGIESEFESEETPDE
jgi:hypothetical protein